MGNPTGLEHRPDAEVQVGEHLVAIRVELKAKKPKQMPAILYNLSRHYDGIWYFCSPALEGLLRQSFAQLDPAARRKFSLVRLPEERAAAAGQPATPPHPPTTRLAETAASEGSGQHKAEVTAGPRDGLAGQPGDKSAADVA